MQVPVCFVSCLSFPPFFFEGIPSRVFCVCELRMVCFRAAQLGRASIFAVALLQQQVRPWQHMATHPPPLVGVHLATPARNHCCLRRLACVRDVTATQHTHTQRERHTERERERETERQRERQRERERDRERESLRGVGGKVISDSGAGGAGPGCAVKHKQL